MRPLMRLVRQSHESQSPGHKVKSALTIPQTGERAAPQGEPWENLPEGRARAAKREPWENGKTGNTRPHKAEERPSIQFA